MKTVEQLLRLYSTSVNGFRKQAQARKMAVDAGRAITLQLTQSEIEHRSNMMKTRDQENVTATNPRVWGCASTGGGRCDASSYESP